jgi:hypothetical protein
MECRADVHGAQSIGVDVRDGAGGCTSGPMLRAFVLCGGLSFFSLTDEGWSALEVVCCFFFSFLGSLAAEFSHQWQC